MMLLSGISVAQTLLCIYSTSVVVCLNCNFLRMRDSQMRQLSAAIITANKLYDISLTTVVKCSSYCISDEKCLYMIVDKVASKCTFYSFGSINISVSHLQTFELVERSIQVLFLRAKNLYSRCYKLF